MASERTICRSVIDRNDVIKNQVFESVRTLLGDKVDQAQLKEIQKTINSIFELHTYNLVGSISKQFSD